MAMTGSDATASASTNGSSAGASQTPTSVRARSASRLACHTASGTMTGTPSGTPSPRTIMNASSTTLPRLISRGIHALLEGVDADAPNGIHEPLVLVADVDVRLDQPRDDVRHVVGRERRADHLADRRVLALGAADRDLVPLRPVLVDAQNADVTDVMVAARVHAPADVEVELAD